MYIQQGVNIFIRKPRYNDGRWLTRKLQVFLYKAQFNHIRVFVARTNLACVWLVLLKGKFSGKQVDLFHFYWHERNCAPEFINILSLIFFFMLNPGYLYVKCTYIVWNCQWITWTMLYTTVLSLICKAVLCAIFVFYLNNVAGIYVETCFEEYSQHLIIVTNK